VRTWPSQAWAEWSKKGPATPSCRSPKAGASQTFPAMVLAMSIRTPGERR
jgi:hypothetical protein